MRGNATPIPTKYKGTQYRSKLEAKWAVFFDEMGIEFMYEPEGYDLDGTYYLPDFWLPQVKMWAEVKPGKLNKEEARKCQKLADATEHLCLLLEGQPACRSYWALAPIREVEDGWYSDETDFILNTDYLNEGRFFSQTGYPRDRPATDEEYIFLNDYVAAVSKARIAFSWGVTPGMFPA